MVNAMALTIRYSLTLMTTLSSDTPVVYEIRKDTNTQWDFLAFLTSLIDDKFLIAGDVLVCDNAAVHVADQTTDLVFDLLESNGIVLLFLPAYSPELNPCELVFSFIKEELRRLRPSPSIWRELFLAIAKVTPSHIARYYDKCIWHATST